MVRLGDLAREQGSTVWKDEKLPLFWPALRRLNQLKKRTFLSLEAVSSRRKAAMLCKPQGYSQRVAMRIENKSGKPFEQKNFQRKTEGNNVSVTFLQKLLETTIRGG